MKAIRFYLWISFVVLVLASTAALFVANLLPVWAQVGTPPSSTISSSSGPLAWDFAPVGGGTVINVGIQDICPPGLCDDHDLTVVLPAPAATFYQTMTANLTFQYTWTSALPTDLDIFAISPSGADHGPGSPDNTSTGTGQEVLTVTDPIDGLWHIRSVAALAPVPTAAHVAVTLTTGPDHVRRSRPFWRAKSRVFFAAQPGHQRAFIQRRRWQQLASHAGVGPTCGRRPSDGGRRSLRFPGAADANEVHAWDLLLFAGHCDGVLLAQR